MFRSVIRKRPAPWRMTFSSKRRSSHTLLLLTRKSRVGAVTFEHAPRLHDVAAALRHLLALGIEHEVVHYHRAIRRRRAIRVVGQCITEPAGDGEQRIEPAARLVEPFR